MNPVIHCRLKEWINTRHDPNVVKDTGKDTQQQDDCAMFYFDDYPAMTKELPADLMDFMETYGSAGIRLRGWLFAKLGHITGRQHQRHVVFGGNYLGLGHYLNYVYDRDACDIKMVNEDDYVMRKYVSWSEALHDLLDHDFGWEYFIENDTNGCPYVQEKC